MSRGVIEIANIFDTLAQEHWRLLLGALLGFLGWRLVAGRLYARPLARNLPGLVALADLFLLPSVVMIAGALLRLAATELHLVSIAGTIHALTLLLTYLVVGWGLARLAEVLLMHRGREQLSARVPKLVIGIIYAVMLLLGLVLFLWQRGYSFTGVWVSTGVLAGVVGFALQKTLGDLFSGIALGIEQPFHLGDWVELGDGTVGQVIDLNWRSTRLRGWDNATFVIPNSQMAGQPIKNLHDDQHLYAPWYFVKIPAEVNPRFATALLLDAAMRCESVLQFPHPIVRLADAASLPYSYMVWVHLKNYPAMFRAREELFREIHRGLQQAGIELAPEVHELRTRRAHIASAEPPSILLALRSLDVGGLLSETELEQVAARSTYCHFDNGQIILAEGAKSDAFYVIASGLVEASITLPEQVRLTTETLGPGQQFGITSMLTEDPSFLELTAKSHVSLVRIELDCLRRIITERPELAEQLAQIVKQRLDAADAAREASRQTVRRLSMRDIRQRIERLVARPARLSRKTR